MSRGLSWRVISAWEKHLDMLLAGRVLASDVTVDLITDEETVAVPAG